MTENNDSAEGSHPAMRLIGPEEAHDIETEEKLQDPPSPHNIKQNTAGTAKSTSYEDVSKRGSNHDHQQPEHTPIEDYTVPPRVSFGIELEFLVATLNVGDPSPDPDQGIAHLLPPLYYGTGENCRREIQERLRDSNVPVFEHPTYANPTTFSKPAWDRMSNRILDSWVVKLDPTVIEPAATPYTWVAVEITSPASYAFDEAFEMITVVVSIITSNFRCRVNSTCGFHVHLGNGPRHLDLRTARNFAALWWAAEPLLTMLHSPERALGNWSASGRRTSHSVLASGGCMEEALMQAKESPTTEARYFGRARKLGEKPTASVSKFTARTTRAGHSEVDCDSDETDWQIGGEPFQRPKRAKGKKGEIKGKESAGTTIICDNDSSYQPLYAYTENLDEGSIAKGPPQTEYLAPRILQQLRGAERALADTFGNSYSRSIRPCKPDILQRRMPRISNKDRSLDRLIDSGVWKRLPPLQDVYLALNGSNEAKQRQLTALRPSRKDTWSGVKEILACDIGIHQIAYLMDTAKGGNLRWEFYEKETLGMTSALGSTREVTVEAREARGSLNGQWVATWARILCRLMEWARDVDSAELMRVIGRCAGSEMIATTDEASSGSDSIPTTAAGSRAGREPATTYNVIDLLLDLGLFQEARFCEQRLKNGDKAYYECLMLQHRKMAPLTPVVRAIRRFSPVSHHGKGEASRWVNFQ